MSERKREAVGMTYPSDMKLKIIALLVMSGSEENHGLLLLTKDFEGQQTGCASAGHPGSQRNSQVVRSPG